MKKIFIASLLLLSISGKYSFAATATCNATDQAACERTPGCRWTPAAGGGNDEGTGGGTPPPQGTCSQCPENTYGTGCKTCPSDYPNSAAGSTAQTDCYEACPENDTLVNNGKWTYTTPKVNWSPNEKTCDDYKELTCDTVDNNVCLSYHVAGDVCELNWKQTSQKPQQYNQQIDNCKKYLEVYRNNDWRIQSACTECITGYHLSGAVTFTFQCQIETKLGVQCDSDNQKCSDLEGPTGIENCQYKSHAKDPQYTWNDTTQSYNYADCTKICEVQEGWQRNEYIYEYTGTEWQRSSSTGNKKCDTGTCILEKGDTCKPTPKDYYANTNECIKCPAGTQTSKEGATSKSDCKITNQTPFCDLTGCFTLPISDTDTITYF